MRTNPAKLRHPGICEADVRDPFFKDMDFGQRLRRLRNDVAKVFFILSISASLSGCVFGAFAGGGAAGGTVAADNRDIGQQAQDQSLQQKIGNLIYKDQALHDNTHITISVYEDNVLLAGQSKTESLREKAEKYAYSVEGVKRVYNQITLGEPISTWTQTQDAWLTTKVKSALVGTSGLRASHIKVVTDNSIVYLFGRVNQQEANLAAHAASQVEGVHQVVTLFRDPSTNAGVSTNSA